MKPGHILSMKNLHYHCNLTISQGFPRGKKSFQVKQISYEADILFV